MQYLTPLSEFRYNLRSKKLEGLVRLTKQDIPTVSNLFILLPKLFVSFQNNGELPKTALREIRSVFFSIRKQQDTVTLRNSIYELGNPGIAFSVANTLNIRDFDQFSKRLLWGYRKVLREAINPSRVEYSYLLQSFYSSKKCGVILTDNGHDQIYIQAILGQHTNLLLRGDIEPDTYTVNKKTYAIADKRIARKIFRVKKTKNGVRKVRVKKDLQHTSALADTQIRAMAKLSQKLERAYGPQEIEWAVLDTDKIIFQETRDLQHSQNIKVVKRAELIFPQETAGEVIVLEKTPKESVADKIVVTNNLSIGFINKLAFLYRPKAVILTRGSITAHAATVLREAQIPTVLVRQYQFTSGEGVKITSSGGVEKYEL